MLKKLAMCSYLISVVAGLGIFIWSIVSPKSYMYVFKRWYDRLTEAELELE